MASNVAREHRMRLFRFIGIGETYSYRERKIWKKNKWEWKIVYVSVGREKESQMLYTESAEIL